MTPQNVTDDLATAYVKLKADHAQLRAHAARLEARVLGAEQAVAEVMRGAGLDVGTTNTLIGRLWEALREEGPPSTETDTLRADLEALRAKARAYLDAADDFAILGASSALRAELDKPSGADELTRLRAIAAAWLALEQARREEDAVAQEPAKRWGAAQARRKAEQALRALGVE